VASAILTTGITAKRHKTVFRRELLKARPAVFGIAVAYVSTSGFHLMKAILAEGGVTEVRLVTDTRDAITHPKALELALESGWNVRVVDSLSGTFHPKLYAGAGAFDTSGQISDVSLLVTGSANMSLGGFVKNGECGYWSTGLRSRPSAEQAWLDCWTVGKPLTPSMLNDYEKRFALRNRHRSPLDLVALGVADEIPEITKGGAPKKGIAAPKTSQKAISETSATVAWAGLQSFTGEYNLQIEFPKEAGLVLRRLFGRLSGDGAVNIRCSDGNVRQFRYKYYDHNGMFRLNVPNTVPLVEWARTNKAGIAYVEHSDEPDELDFEILKPGWELEEIVDRSLALGTWGRTPTRLFGWY